MDSAVENNTHSAREGNDEQDHERRRGSRPQPDRTATRRRVLLAGAAAATVGTAGCSGVTSQSFAADPVGLSGNAQDEIRMHEQSTDSTTVSWEGPIADVEASITSRMSVYNRAVWLRGESDGGE